MQFLWAFGNQGGSSREERRVEEWRHTNVTLESRFPPGAIIYG